MRLNARLDTVGDYPFDRLRTLLGDVSPPTGMTPIPLSLGEPKHAPPAFLAETVAGEAAGWSKYPPMKGTEAARADCRMADRRYHCRMEWSTAKPWCPSVGYARALFMIALTAVPETGGESLSS